MKKSGFAVLCIFCTIAVFALAVFAVYKFGGDPVKYPADNIDESVNETQPVTQAPTEPDKVELMLKDMSLEEKVAQMIMVSCHENVNIADASSYGVGGLCLYDYSFEDKTKDEVKAMVDSFQLMANVDMLVSTDEEGGTVNRVSINPQLRETPFLSPAELDAQGGLELVRSDTIEKAQLLLSLGINVNLAPVCDVPLSEDNYIFDRCYSLDHDKTALYVSTVVSVMKEQGIGSTLKHFPGYGGSVDTHESMSYDNREYQDFTSGDFKPFVSGIQAGADCVLVSHNIVTCMDQEMPASLSENVHNILRNELFFDGVVITDDLVMEGVAQFTDGQSAVVQAVKAGNDMVMCEDYRAAVDAIMLAVENNEISIVQIDQSVKRILRWKFDLGILS